ncbi:MAG: hypothetical protein LBN93_01640 [Candidatus Symbiothrix sp.]|jgi:16S rRNA processing protein RimM|nr:hypothetical protein [Candidatus Symbiothrix sp.]
MIRRDDLVKIGKFNKPHGVSGEIQLSIQAPLTPLKGALNSPLEGGLAGAFLVCELDNIFVPFRVIESRFISGTTAYIRLKNITSGEAVRVLVNKDVYFDKFVIAGATRNPLELNAYARMGNARMGKVRVAPTSWDFFRGYTLIDKTAGKIGTISDIDDSTPNILFIVEPKWATHASPLHPTPYTPNPTPYTLHPAPILIPANTDFIISIDEKQQQIHLELPEGLLEL